MFYLKMAPVLSVATKRLLLNEILQTNTVRVN